MNVPAIPTTYAGVNFRSRLEAKWAAMFDLLGWRWEYEPEDLHMYIPDFVLYFDRPLLVEVKPVSSVEDFAEMAPERAKIQQSGWDGEAIIVGSRIWDRPCGDGFYQLGWIWSPRDGWDDAFPFRCIDCGSYSFASASYSWQCRVKGCYEGNGHIDRLTDDFQSLFRQAGNMVQWRPAA